jgi:chromosome segregation ATPase
MPWSASVGNYGTLIAVPDQETIIRAPESASLVSLSVRPGDQVAGGAVIGQLGNLDLEEQIVAVQSDLARAGADRDRLQGDLRAREESAVRAETLLRQRQLEYNEIESERRQIARQQQVQTGEIRMITASTAAPQFDQPARNYPAALAVLQAELESSRAQLSEATAQRDRMRKLNADGLIARSELDAAEMRAATCGSAFAAARQRLEAALIEHRRKHASTTTEVNLSNSDLSAERLQIAKLNSGLNVTRELITTLEAHRELLTRKRAQFALTTQRGGTIFGEELPRMMGQ